MSWEDEEEFDAPVGAVSKLDFEEEDEGLMSDWEAGLDSDDDSKKAPAKPKLSASERIADRKRKEQIEREKKALEKSDEASKMEKRQMELDADLDNASDLLASADVHPREKSNKKQAAPAPAGPAKLSDLAIFKPKTAKEYADLRKTVTGVINDLAKTNSMMLHTNFIIELCRDLCAPLTSDQVGRVDSTIEAIGNQKYREERAKRLGSRAKPNLKVAAQKASAKPKVEIAEPEALEDDGLGDDDFM
ncbi:translation initiation factor eIF3 core subunit J [Starmerella bacillaris]|uniref:Eukaryotic translation initiation factor 3 30 kDa subunit n=1 Tax=Starmerella bacillaris TaxID=1247836 RepID=A0AAV5RNL5_STABA|nr:translation initiation factor eIF3 core subunit J [Starmerella bacillaris]